MRKLLFAPALLVAMAMSSSAFAVAVDPTDALFWDPVTVTGQTVEEYEVVLLPNGGNANTGTVPLKTIVVLASDPLTVGVGTLAVGQPDAIYYAQFRAKTADGFFTLFSPTIVLTFTGTIQVTPGPLRDTP